MSRSKMLLDVLLGLGGIFFRTSFVPLYAVQYPAIYHIVTHNLVGDVFVSVGVAVADW